MHDDAPFAGTFGLVHGLVRERQQLVGMRGPGRARDDADARADLSRSATDVVGLGDGGQNSPRHRFGFGRGGRVGQKHGELVAAEAHREVDAS